MMCDSPKNEVRRARRACVQCKSRKKKCSGELPCSYCVKIGKDQNCEYRARRTSKTVNVTLKYLRSLKARINELEEKSIKNRKWQKVTSKELEHELGERNPLIESDDEQSFLLNGKSIKVSLKSKNEPEVIGAQYMGNSSCSRFLSKIEELLIASGSLYDKPQSEEIRFKSNTLEVSSDFLAIEQLVMDNLPTIERASRLIRTAEKTIGADYMFIEPDYETQKLKKIIYALRVPRNEANVVHYVTEMTRFYAYLALGSLFDYAADPPQYPGLVYFKTSLSLQAYLQKAYDTVGSICLAQTYLYLSFYSLSLNKSSFAYMMVGLAVRMVFSLGFHKRTATFAQNRVFWLCFIYDRLLAIRLGLPTMIDESSIEVPFLDENNGELESISLNNYFFSSHVKLAKITTRIMVQIYSRNSVPFIRSCCEILENLQNWREELPYKLKLDYDNIKTSENRSIFNLHINYNYSIILTTKPVLFYVFMKVLVESKDARYFIPEQQLHSVNALLEACTQAAEVQSRILTKLFYDNKFAVCSFFDCHFIFSATIILILRLYCQATPSFGTAYNRDVSDLRQHVRSNLKLLAALTEFNFVAAVFNSQLTSLIKLVSSRGPFGSLLNNAADEGVGSSDGTTSSNFEAHWEPESLLDGRGIDTFGIVDISQLLNDISNRNLLDDFDPFSNEIDSVDLFQMY